MSFYTCSTLLGLSLQQLDEGSDGIGGEFFVRQQGMESPYAVLIRKLEKTQRTAGLGNHGITDKGGGQSMLCQTVCGGQLGKHQFDMGSEAGFPEQDLTALMEVVSWGQKDEGQILESGQREGQSG